MSQWEDVITGCLLGDGHLDGEYSFALTNTHLDYVEYVHSILNEHFRTNTKIMHRRRQVNCSQVHVCKFNKVEVFRPLRRKWYPNSKKIPNDLLLSPTVCRHWYIDDGSLIVHKKGEQTKNGTSYQSDVMFVQFYTNGFEQNDVEYLSDLLNGTVGLNSYLARARKDKDQWQIKLHAEDVPLFLDYIGICPIDSYAYKWDVKGYQFHEFTCYCGQTIKYGAFHGYRKTCGNIECKIKYRMGWQKQNPDKVRHILENYKERNSTANRDAQRRYRARKLMAI